jgi:hypothetical protein
MLKIQIYIGFNYLLHISHMRLLILICLIVGTYSQAIVNIHDVAELEFKSNKLTDGRKQLPELTCNKDVLHSHCDESGLPTTMICKNDGHDLIGSTKLYSYGIKWKCTTDATNKNVAISNILIMCEGVAYKTDPIIINNSCRAVYEATKPETTSEKIETIGTTFLDVAWQILMFGLILTPFAMFAVACANMCPRGGFMPH